MHKISYIPLTYPPERFIDYSAYKEIFGYDNSYQFYGAFHRGQQVGYGAVKDGEIVHVSSVDPEIDNGLKSLMQLHGNSDIVSAAKGKEPKDMIKAPIPGIYDIHKKHIQIGYEGEHTKDIKPYRGEFSKGAIVEFEYQPGGKMIIYPSNTALYTTRQIRNCWQSQFPQMEITSVEIENEGKTHKIAQENENLWNIKNMSNTSMTIFGNGNNKPNPELISIERSKNFWISTKESMALDPNYLNSWMKQNGPYLFHGTQQEYRPAIEQNGILPWNQISQGSQYSDQFRPRQNHVYLSKNFATYPYPYNAYYAVDLRKLNPQLMQPDEDAFWDEDPNPRVKIPDIERAMQKGLPTSYTHPRQENESWGDWAERNNLNQTEAVQHSLEELGNIAYNGVIPANAIHYLNPNDGKNPVDRARGFHTLYEPGAEVNYLRDIGLDHRMASNLQMNPGEYLKVLTNSDPAASIAQEALKFAGGKVYVVGGAVRDVLRGQDAPKDLDLMVAGLPTEEVHNILSKLPGRVDLTGKKFGVYRYRHDGSEVEIALPRQDKYETSRRGEGVITVDHNLPIDKDLERRDFTVNSIASDLDTGELIDPYGGQSDLEKNILRTTHPDSFREDPTRLVRALTAHSRFGLNPDERTRSEMASNAHLLRSESPDALNKHLDKLFASHNPAAAIRLAHETGVLKHLFPEVEDGWSFEQNNKHHNYPLGEHLMQVLGNVSELTPDPDVRMAAMMHDVGKPGSEWKDPQTGQSHFYEKHLPDGTVLGADHEVLGAKITEDRLRALNYPNARIKRISHLVNHHMFPAGNSQKWARKFLNRVGDEHADDLLNIRQADMNGKGQGQQYFDARTPVDHMRGLVDEVRKGQQPTDLSNLAINGNDLIEYVGMKPGPAIGTVMRQLLDHVIEVPTDNNHSKLIELAKQFANASISK